jgi:hypothetical protein
MVKLYDVINSVGKNRDADESRNKLVSQGYTKDKSLSNRNNQVYYNDKTNDLIYNVRGSNSIRDIPTNLALGLGFLKSTKRYIDSHQGLRQAKSKYKIDGVKVTGESLGGGIASLISSRNDKVSTYNKATAPFQKSRNNENSYRIQGDAVSLFNANHKNNKTLNNDHIIVPSVASNILNAHTANNLKDKNIYV